jgi:glutamyl-tRNA(Gln) amidotransferase subunit E
MRGLGTIRQDLNISIQGGALTEIKGVQELEIIPLVIEYEVQRQLNLIKISQELQKTGAKEEDLKEEFFDVTPIFKTTKCKVLQKALEKNQKILAAKLPKFSGFLKRELMPNIRLGTEMADRAKFWGRVCGIFHTDELPAYGIAEEEIEALRKMVNAEEEDAVVFVADAPENAEDALKAVLERAKEALKGVPEETRAANPDGTTHYMRPRPGAARMYPETDIPPTQITENYIRQVLERLPELPEQKLERFMRDYGLNQKLAKQILDSEYCELFEAIAEESKISPTTIAAFLTETMKALKREGVKVEKVSENQLKEIFKRIGSGELAKEALPEVVNWLAKNEGKSVYEAIQSLDLKILSKEDIEKIVDEVIEANKNLTEKVGRHTFGAVMGLVMKKLRGKANAELVNEIVKKKLESKTQDWTKEQRNIRLELH